MKKYFKITGLDEGKPIKPYGVETNGTLPYEIVNQPCGDAVRWYERISKEEFLTLPAWYEAIAETMLELGIEA